MPHGGQCAIPFFPFSFNFLCNLLVIIFFHLLQNLKQITCFDFYEYVGFFLFPLLIFNKNIELKELCLKSSIACASGKENRFRLIAQPRNIEYNINNEASSLTMNSREDQKGIGTKKEVDLSNSSKTTTTTSSSRQWSCHKNPRIVRVSRTFGGKDRHSKVCTVRGLRDRRIRLSVPTAIQLYDLQDRLGLNQPSKVIDWLLDATDQEIDKLPPLPMLPLFHQPPNNPQYSSKNSGLNNPTKDQGDIATAVSQQDEQENQEGFGGFVAQLSAQNLFPLNNGVQSSSFANFPYNPYSFHWDHGYGYPMPNQADQDHSQLYFCPSAANMPPIIPSFPSYFTPSMDSDWRQMQNLQQNPLLPTTLNLISSPMKSSLNVNSKSGHLQQNGNERREKDKRF